MDTFRQDLFRGKVLFCTGGRSGICYEITQTMMGLGADAAIVGRDAKGLEESANKLSKATGRKCLATPADVRDAKAVQGAVKATIEKFGRIDFVVCGAAGNFLVPISGMSENAFKTVVEIDLLGTYHTVKATLPHLRESKGAYLHIGVTLHYRGTPWQAHVSAAKAGVHALSRVIAVEEGPRGVRSNVIAPGLIGDTGGWDRLSVKDYDPSKGVPLGRIGTKMDIAQAAVFIFSPAAEYITGTEIPVDGGDHHLYRSPLPYPKSVLEPESMKSLVKAKM
ncbi:hypothetical protein BD324DRAFT_611614 [Kockovaella imperatae]|uniref:2,4-dienoyl-CoA reductase [(3E)-enoyl-CoA-producing] n=1 Tax=Kockovaella imperatae TaxID=4999 RepID=A0A1Y1URT2_9TREE|nr:hypothetical protein BD324DRAFT_611614 [Kockovaella imperatae]ORX40642.1 hypothetical protein BD324DRAFT_611614 [Kockovaella imperatae]